MISLPVESLRGEYDRLFRKRCSEFARIRLGRQLYPEYATYLDSREPEIMLLWSRQVGKSTGSAIKLLHGALYEPGTLALIVSASQRQANRVQRWVTTFMLMLHRPESWEQLKELDLPDYEPDEEAKIVKRSVMALELANGSEIISVPASPETVRGYSPNRIVLDEAAWIPDDVYEAVRPMRVMTRAQLIACSSAGAQRGWFYEGWMNDTGLQKLYVRADQCPIIPEREEFLEREQQKMPPAIFRREYENEFLPVSGGLFSPEMIRDMYSDAVKPMAWVPAGAGSNGHQIQPMEWRGKR